MTKFIELVDVGTFEVPRLALKGLKKGIQGSDDVQRHLGDGRKVL